MLLLLYFFLDRNSPMKQLSKGDGADDTPTAFQGMLDFFKYEISCYHKMSFLSNDVPIFLSGNAPGMYV